MNGPWQPVAMPAQVSKTMFAWTGRALRPPTQLLCSGPWHFANSMTAPLRPAQTPVGYWGYGNLFEAQTRRHRRKQCGFAGGGKMDAMPAGPCSAIAVARTYGG